MKLSHTRKHLLEVIRLSFNFKGRMKYIGKRIIQWKYLTYLGTLVSF